MWQRIQTIYLMLAAAGNFVLLAPAAAFAYVAQPTESGIMADGKFNVYDNTGILLLTILAGALSFLAIFLFKNRGLQSKLTWLAAATAVAALGFTGWVSYQSLPQNPNGLAWIGHVLAVFFDFLAVRGIRRDEKTVRSMDRLR